MPENAPSVKRNAVRDTYKGTVIECESTVKAREETCERVMKETGATFIAPYDNKMVIAGQGTMALELLEDFPELDAIIAPVGGGGMVCRCIESRFHSPFGSPMAFVR
jgi:threonine dehydratase